MTRKLNQLTPTAETLEAFQNCANLLKQAQEALNPITKDMTNWGAYDAAYLKIDISKLLSSDAGECGLQALIKMIERQIPAEIKNRK